MASIWIADNEAVVSLRWGTFLNDEPREWGRLTADLVAHVARAAMAQTPGLKRDEAFALIESGFRERLADNPTLTGAFATSELHLRPR